MIQVIISESFIIVQEEPDYGSEWSLTGCTYRFCSSFWSVFLWPPVLSSGGFFLSPRARSGQMGMSYECGMRPLSGARIQFHLNYYIYALIFLAFEVDVLYLFPVALFYSEATGSFSVL